MLNNSTHSCNFVLNKSVKSADSRTLYSAFVPTGSSRSFVRITRLVSTSAIVFGIRREARSGEATLQGLWYHGFPNCSARSCKQPRTTLSEFYLAWCIRRDFASTIERFGELLVDILRRRWVWKKPRGRWNNGLHWHRLSCERHANRSVPSKQFECIIATVTEVSGQTTPEQCNEINWKIRIGMEWNEE